MVAPFFDSVYTLIFYLETQSGLSLADALRGYKNVQSTTARPFREPQLPVAQLMLMSVTLSNRRIHM